MPVVNGKKKTLPKKRPPKDDPLPSAPKQLALPRFAAMGGSGSADPVIRATLPVHFVPAAGDGAGEFRPAIVLVPPHLRSKTGSGAPPSEGAVGSSSNASTGNGKGPKGKKPKKPKKPKDDGDDSNDDDDAVSTPFPTVDAGDFIDLAESILDPDSELAGASAGIAARKAASYDFAEYVLLRNPDDPYAQWPGGNAVIPADPRFALFCSETMKSLMGYMQSMTKAYSSQPWNPLLDFLAALLGMALYKAWHDVTAVRAFNRFGTYRHEAVMGNGALVPLERYYAWSLCSYLDDHFSAEIITLVKAPQTAPPGPLATVQAWDDAVDGVFDEYFKIIDTVDPTAPMKDYAFEPYSPNEVLFGLRIIHRQDWRRLGYARGELVKSVPLGPRETQRLSVEISTRRKTARTSEQSTSFETTSESTNTNRNTTEVVDEATAKLNKKAEASVGGGYPGIFNASVSGGISEDLGSSSKQTKSALNELMEKTASRMRRDTKVTVSTENETTFKDTRTTEITNPNDELGITYLYFQLQLRYWVTTEIAGVESVVFVPQRVPEWNEITESWVRDHADAIAQALLDPSFAPVISAIRQEPTTLAYQATNVFDSAANASISAVAQYRQFTGGGDMPDILASGQQFYERDYERRANLNIEQQRRAHQSEALMTHLRRNILHYMRAIWESEDYDQRMQRYSRMRVPISWFFVPLTPLPTGTTATPFDVEGVFMPDPMSAKPLTDVIDPIGPIGYHLNCAIYRLRDDARLVNLHQALAYLRAAYTHFDVFTQVTSAAVKVRQAIAYSPRSFSADYTIQFGQQKQKWLVVVANKPETQWPETTTMPDGSIDVYGVRLWLDGNAAAGDKIQIRLRVTPDLEDPYLKLLQTRYPLPPPADEATFFSDDLLREMTYAFPQLEGIEGKKWGDLTADQKATVKSLYHLYVTYRDTGRLVTIDSPNLVLDLEGSTSPALEPFKRLHRYVDVLKEFEEMRRRTFDNRRRNDLIDQGELGDPDIDRVTLVGAPKMLEKVIAIPDPDPDE